MRVKAPNLAAAHKARDAAAIRVELEAQGMTRVEIDAWSALLNERGQRFVDDVLTYLRSAGLPITNGCVSLDAAGALRYTPPLIVRARLPVRQVSSALGSVDTVDRILARQVIEASLRDMAAGVPDLLRHAADQIEASVGNRQVPTNGAAAE